MVSQSGSIWQEWECLVIHLRMIVSLVFISRIEEYFANFARNILLPSDTTTPLLG